VTDYYLTDIYHLLKNQLLTQDILHCDETSYKVIESDSAKTYYWVAESSVHHKQQVVLYYHNRSRSGRVVKEFLSGYSGYIHCDMWHAYQQLQEVTLVGCFAHVRRKFYDALPTNYTDTNYSTQAVVKIDELFELEREWRPLSKEERLEKRQEILKPKLNEFFEWIGDIDALPKTALGKAIEYALKFQQHFLTVLEDGRLELSNNRAERAVKTLVMGRKNWLFSTSFEGAKSTATILSILETAKANGLNSRQYMQYLLEELPQLTTTKNPERLEAYLPWHPDIQAKFKKNEKIPY
jgi:transposase